MLFRSIAAEQVVAYRGIAQGVHLMAVKAEERLPEVLSLAGLAAHSLVAPAC